MHSLTYYNSQLLSTCEWIWKPSLVFSPSVYMPRTLLGETMVNKTISPCLCPHANCIPTAAFFSFKKKIYYGQKIHIIKSRIVLWVNPSPRWLSFYHTWFIVFFFFADLMSFYPYTLKYTSLKNKQTKDIFLHLNVTMPNKMNNNFIVFSNIYCKIKIFW